MNMSRIGMTTRSNVVTLAIIWAVGGLGSLAQAAGPSVFTWNSAVSGNWSDSSLWTNDLATGTAPIAAGQQDYTLNFTQAGTYTATNDLNDGFLLNQIKFGGAVTLDGSNGVALTANNATLPQISQNSASAVTISAPLVLGANASFLGTGNGQVSLTGLVSGAGSLTKDSPGTLTITGLKDNTYSGGTIIKSGTLNLYDVQGFKGLGTGPVTLNGGVFKLDRFSATNDVTVNGGSILITNGFASTLSSTFTNNVQLNLTVQYTLGHTLSGVISGAGGITLTSLNGGGVILSGTNTYTGDTIVTSGVLGVRGSSIKDTNKLVISGGKVQATGTETVNTLFFGTNQQVKGTWGATGSGAAHIDDTRFTGTAGVVNVTTGLPENQADILAFGLPGAPAVITGTNIAWTVPAGTNLTSLAPTFTLSFAAVATPVSGTTRNFTTPQTYSINSGDGTILNKIYTVTVSLGSVPTIFTWAAPVTGNWSDATKWTNDLSTGSAPAFGGASSYTLNFNQPGSYTTTNDLSAGFLLNQLNFGGAVTVSGDNGLTLAANGAALPQINQNSASAVSISTPLSMASNLTVGGSGGAEVTISGVVSGAGKLTKTSSGRLTVTAANTYTGGTVLSAGSLYVRGDTGGTLGAPGSVNLTIASGTTLQGERTNFTGTLTMNGGTWSENNGFGGSWTGPVTLGATAVLDDAYGQSINGIVSGPGGLTKTGGGTLTLNGASTFAGAMTVNAGTLSVSSLNSVAGGTTTSNLGKPTTVADGTLSFGSGGSAATLRYTGTGETTDRVLNMAGSTGGLTLDDTGASGLLKFTSALTATGSGVKALTLKGTSTGAGEIGGAIVDSAGGATSVIKSSLGTWILSGANTYSGTTTINAGILTLTKPAALYNAVESSWTSANITVAPYATLAVNAGGVGEFSPTQIGSLFSKLATISNNGLTEFSTFGVDTTHATGTVTVSASLTDSTGTGGGAVSIAKRGVGTLELTGENTFTGTIAVNAGVLSIGGAGRLGSGSYASTITIDGGATFTYHSTAAQTVSGDIFGAGGLQQSGPGTLTLGGFNGYSGVTTVIGGTLVVNGYSIDDSVGKLVITGGKVQPTAQEDVDTLFFGTTQQAAGTWGASGSGAEHIDNVHFTGSSGVVNVITGPPVTGTYDDWAGEHGLFGADAYPDADPDFDGIGNALEFVLGGEPNPANANSNSVSLLPKVSQVSGNLLFTFERKVRSEELSTLTFQWSTNLTFPGANDVPVGAVSSTTGGVAVDFTKGSPDVDTDTIVITVPAAKAAGGKVFGRLRATVP